MNIKYSAANYQQYNYRAGHEIDSLPVSIRYFEQLSDSRELKSERILTLVFVFIAGVVRFDAAVPSRALAQSSETSSPIRVERNLTFREIDGERLAADVYRPDSLAWHPLVVMIHGGAWSAGDKWQVQDHARELAQAGFVAVAINYRLAPKHKISAQIADCRAGLGWAVENSGRWHADATRCCLWGYSAGAHLAALIATDPRATEPQLKAVVAGGAPCEFSFIPPASRALVHVIGATRQENPAAYDAVSPLAHASSAACPFFFFHGTADILVPPSSSTKMYDKLSELKVDTQYYRVENRGHLLTFIDTEARKRAIAFLRKHTAEEK